MIDAFRLSIIHYIQQQLYYSLDFFSVYITFIYLSFCLSFNLCVHPSARLFVTLALSPTLLNAIMTSMQEGSSHVTGVMSGYMCRQAHGASSRTRQLQ